MNETSESDTASHEGNEPDPATAVASHLARIRAYRGMERKQRRLERLMVKIGRPKRPRKPKPLRRPAERVVITYLATEQDEEAAPREGEEVDYDQE